MDEFNPEDFEMVNGEVIPMRTWLIPMSTRELVVLLKIANGFIAEKTIGVPMKLDTEEIANAIAIVAEINNKVGAHVNLPELLDTPLDLENSDIKFKDETGKKNE